jgi:large subunit ribosomal protein L17
MIDSKLGRKKEHRERTLRNLLTSLVLYEKVRTTEAKAKTLKPIAERLISTALKGSLDARRSIKAIVFDSNAVSKIFEDLPARQGDRNSGFVRLTKLPPRPGDAAPMALLELIMVPLEDIIQKESKTKIAVRKKVSLSVENPDEN